MADLAEKISYKTSFINNRRYLGNKYKLLPFITRVAAAECPDIESVADIFAGTGAVASAFSDKQLITNDLLYSNYICNFAWFGAMEYDAKKIIDYVACYNAAAECEENYMTENFADTYFSHDDCAKIGFIREDIEQNFRTGKINDRERALLITSLLYAMDKIANTCGHYDAYRKKAGFHASLELSVPQAAAFNNPANRCYNADANELAKKISADLIYIDPPYNSRQYSDAYHLLENVARWEKPPVFGVAKKMNRAKLKSRYCTQGAAEAFADLIESLRAKYILFSYNNMAAKGNSRSNAKISDDEIMQVLQRKGAVKVFSESYKAFSAGKSSISGNAERLFLCACFEE
jgi:adenine-specific DNA-methyltransferase